MQVTYDQLVMETHCMMDGGVASEESDKADWG